MTATKQKRRTAMIRPAVMPISRSPNPCARVEVSLFSASRSDFDTTTSRGALLRVKLPSKDTAKCRPAPVRMKTMLRDTCDWRWRIGGVATVGCTANDDQFHPGSQRSIPIPGDPVGLRDERLYKHSDIWRALLPRVLSRPRHHSPRHRSALGLPA